MQAGFEPGIFRSRGGRLTTRPTRRWVMVNGDGDTTEFGGGGSGDDGGTGVNDDGADSGEFVVNDGDDGGDW